MKCGGPNSDGDFFSPDAKAGGLGNKFVKPKWGKGGSVGYFVSGDSQEQQEREACKQVCIAIIGEGRGSRAAGTTRDQ